VANTSKLSKALSPPSPHPTLIEPSVPFPKAELNIDETEPPLNEKFFDVSETTLFDCSVTVVSR